MSQHTVSGVQSHGNLRSTLIESLLGYPLHLSVHVFAHEAQACSYAFVCMKRHLFAILSFRHSFMGQLLLATKEPAAPRRRWRTSLIDCGAIRVVPRACPVTLLMLAATMTVGTLSCIDPALESLLAPGTMSQCASRQLPMLSASATGVTSVSPRNAQH